MEIRLASLQELPTVATFVSRCFLASPVFAGVDAVRYQPDAIAANLARGQTFLALEGDRLVGSVTRFPADPASACEAFWTRSQAGLLATDPELAGRGIGSALMDFVEASQLQIALSVTQRAPRLLAMYQSRGYKVIDEFHWPGAVDPSFILVKDRWPGPQS